MDQSAPILRTKLHRPTVVGNLVRRQRLNERMNLVFEKPLALVSAPAGYGKSMLVSHWAESLEVPCAWVSLDEADSDLLVFLSYVLAAVDTVAPESCLETRALVATPNRPPLTVLASALTNELDAIDNPFVLVLDDYHRIAPSSEIHELLRLLLEHPPQPLHLVLVTRRDPPLAIASMRASRQVDEVRLQDLRFTVTETAEFLSATGGLEVSDRALTNLHKQTEGWAVGLCLVSQYLRHSDDPEEFLISLEGGLGKSWMEGALTFGIAYFAQLKVTEDRAGELQPILDELQLGRHRGYGFGPELTVPIATKKKLIGFINARFLWETGIRSQLEGTVFTLAASFPIPSIAVQ